jgi:hypothetical protein
MPVLNRHVYEKLCGLNKDYLREKSLISDGSDIDLENINQLIRNEKDIVEA